MFSKFERTIIVLMLLPGVVLFTGMAVSSELGSPKVADTGEAKKYTLADNVKIEYWDNGKPRTMTESNDLDNVVGIAYFRNDGTLEQEKTFDDRGKTLSLAYFNSRGGLKAGADGWAAMVFKYDNGIMRGQGYYDSSGQLKRYQIYNASGDLVCKKYIGDEEPDPTELYSNSGTTSQAPQSFEFYDSYGRPTGKVTSYTGDDWFPYDYPYWHYHRYPIGLPG